MNSTPIGGAAAKKLLTDWVKDAVRGVVNALGASGSAFGFVVSGGDLYLKARR